MAALVTPSPCSRISWRERLSLSLPAKRQKFRNTYDWRHAVTQLAVLALAARGTRWPRRSRAARPARRPPARASTRIVYGQACAGLLKRRTGGRSFEAAFPVCGEASGSPRSNR